MKLSNVAVYLMRNYVGEYRKCIYARACVKMCLKTQWEILQN